MHLLLIAPANAFVAVLQSDIAFGTGSPAYAAVRWLWFLSITGVIGAVTFRLGVVANARGLAPEIRSDAIDRAAHVGLVSAAFALAAAGLRLMAQSVALLGEIGPDVAILITATTWGTAWIIHTVAATAALAAFALAARGVPGAWALAALAVPALAAAPALAGHAAALTSLQPLPIIADTLHVAAGGAWVGGLLVLLTAGLPATRGLGPQPAQFESLVAAFSPLALASAAIIIATGAFASIIHLESLADLVRSDWGRLLALKVGAAIALAAIGARNFLRLKPRLLDPDGQDRMRRSATAELAVGAMLLLITAFLVATSPPAAQDGSAGSAPGEASSVQRVSGDARALGVRAARSTTSMYRGAR